MRGQPVSAGIAGSFIRHGGLAQGAKCHVFDKILSIKGLPLSIPGLTAFPQTLSGPIMGEISLKSFFIKPILIVKLD
jgi:hypothetical protein